MSLAVRPATVWAPPLFVPRHPTRGMSDTRRGSGPDPGDRLDDEELREVVEELTVTLRDVKHELERERERERRDRRGLFGLPRPPSGRELLRFADEFAIPAAITVLEANVELLKHLRRAIRAAQTTRETRARTREVGEEAVSVGGDLLARVGDGLSDLRSAIEGGTIPEDAADEDLLSEVRDLQSEIDDRVDGVGRQRDRDRPRRRSSRRRNGRRDRGDGDRRRDGTDEDTTSEGRAADESDDGRRRRSRPRSGSGRREDDVSIDVDAELESLRERYRGDDEDDTDDPTEPNADTSEDESDADTSEDGSDADTSEDRSDADTSEDGSDANTSDGDEPNAEDSA